MEGEITRDDLKQELLAHWDAKVLRDVGRTCGVEPDDSLSKEEVVEQILDRAPLETLLEELLRRELTSGSEDDDEPSQGGEDDVLSSAMEAAEAASLVGDAPPEAAPLEDDTGAPVAGAATVERDADEVSAVQDAAAAAIHQVEDEGTVVESPPAAALAMPADLPAEEEIPREALEAELSSNWATDEVRALCAHFQVATEGLGKEEQIRHLLDEVSRAAVVEELLKREQRVQAEATAEAAAPPPGPSSEVEDAVRQAMVAAEAEPEPDPEPVREASRPSRPPPRGDDYDDSSLLKELRSMRRETELEDEGFDEEEKRGLGGLGALALVAVALLAVGLLNPSIRQRFVGVPTPPVTAEPPTPESTGAVVPSTGTAAVTGVPVTDPSTAAATEVPTRPAASPTPEVTPAPPPTPTVVARPTPAATPAPLVTSPATASPPPTGAASPVPTPPATQMATPKPTPTRPATVAATVAASPTPSPPPATPTASATPPSTAVASVPPATVEPMDDVHQALDEAQLSLADGDLPRAIYLFSQVLARKQLSPQRQADVAREASGAAFDLGESAFLDGRTEAAMSRLREALEFQPSNAQAHFFMGRCYERIKAYPEAIAAYKKAIEAHETFGKAHAYLAYAYRAQKMYREAEQEAELAQRHGEVLDPGFLFLLRYRPTERAGP